MLGEKIARCVLCKMYAIDAKKVVVGGIGGGAPTKWAKKATMPCQSCAASFRHCLIVGQGLGQGGFAGGSGYICPER